MPISYLSGKSIESYAEMIISILNHKDQHLYAGEVSIHKDVEYIFSFSSLILLAYLGLLNKLQEVSGKCYVSPEVIKSIEIGMKESQKHTKISTGVVVLDEENQLSGYSYTDEDKKARRRLWTTLRLAVSKLIVEEVTIDDVDLYDPISKFSLDVDIESVELSKKTNRILVCDDLFIRKIQHSVTNSTNTTNIMGFLISESLVTYEELLDLLLRLLNLKYLYPLNSEVLLQYSVYINSLSDEDMKKRYFEKLKEIYKYILNEKSAQFYGNIHEEFVRSAISTGLKVNWVYELLREPLNLKPLYKLVSESLQEMLGPE
jgi:hypothetical protein